MGEALLPSRRAALGAFPKCGGKFPQMSLADISASSFSDRAAQAHDRDHGKNHDAARTDRRENDDVRREGLPEHGGTFLLKQVCGNGLRKPRAQLRAWPRT